jgi:hypothetical protein
VRVYGYFFEEKTVHQNTLRDFSWKIDSESRNSSFLLIEFAKDLGYRWIWKLKVHPEKKMFDDHQQECGAF